MPEDAPAAPAAPVSAPASPADTPAPITPPAPAAPETPADISIINEPAAPASPVPPNLVNADGTFVPDWTAKLPDEFSDSRASLAKYRNVGELVKAYQHANTLVGKKGVIPLTPESTPEQVAEYRKTMGVPETADAYAEAIKPKLEIPEGVAWNDDVAKEYFSLAHKHNIPPEAMKDLAQLNAKQQEFQLKAMVSQVAERKQSNLLALRQHWGANFDRNIDVAKRAANRYGIDPNDPGWASPEMVKLVVRMAAEMGEDKIAGPGGALPAGSADFRSRARDIQTNPQNPLHKKYWDGDKDTQHMVREYLKKAG